MNDIIQIYKHDLTRTKTISTLMSLGAEMLYSAYVIENLQSLINFLSEHETKPKDQHELWNYLEPFVWNRLIDDVKLLICFENILKAELIHQGILVHELKGQRRKEQRKRPIKFESLTESDKSELGDFTLSISTIVRKESYFQHLSISDSIRIELDQIINDRNKLHLLNSLNISYERTRALRLKEMKDYTEILVEKIKKNST